MNDVRKRMIEYIRILEYRIKYLEDLLTKNKIDFKPIGKEYEDTDY